MKIEVFAKKLEDYIILIQHKDRVIAPAANKVLGEFTTRVFVDGEDKNNNRFGLYSTKPIYVKSPYPGVKNRNLKRRGKTGKKTKKTAYMGGGYAEFRRKVGRQSSYVDLNLTGSMFLSVGVGKTRGKYAIGFRDKQFAKRGEHFEHKYQAKIFQLSSKERATYSKEITKEVGRIKKQLGL